jgi:replication factor A1
MILNMITLEETIQAILKHLPEYERKDVLSLIDEKRQELGPEIINEESAAMIVARELGIDLRQVSPKARQKVEDISENTRNVALTAKVVHIGPVRKFTRKDGGEGRVASIIVADKTGSIRVALWDDVTKAVSEGAVSIGNVVQLRSAYAKKGLRDQTELNLGRMGGLRILEDYEIDELDLDLDIDAPDSMKIESLQDRQYDITLTVEVKRVFPLSTFTRKSDGSEGKVMSMIVADETASIRLVFWDELAEQMEGTEEGEVIRITGAYTRKGRSDELEVHSGRSSKVERNLDEEIDAVSIETPRRDPLGRKTIDEMKVGMRDVDLEGKVFTIFPVTEFDRDDSTGRVQNVIVVDESEQSIRAAFWEDDVDKIKDLKEGDIIRIEHGYVKKGYRDAIEFGVGKLADITINPEDTQVKDLELPEAPARPTGVADRTPIVDIDERAEGQNVEVCGIIVGVGQVSPVYTACPNCKKKLGVGESGGFRCESCGEDVDEPEYRVLYKITVDDGTGSIRTTLFGEAGEKLLEMTADEAHALIEKTNNGRAPIDEKMDKMLGTYVVVRGRVNRYRDSLDIGANSLSFANPVEEVKKMKASIENLLG